MSEIINILDELGGISFPLFYDEDSLKIEWNTLLKLSNPEMKKRLSQKIMENISLKIDDRNSQNTKFIFFANDLSYELDVTFLGEGSFGKTYRFDDYYLGALAIKVQTLELNVRQQQTKLFLSQSLLEPISLALIQQQSEKKIRHYFPEIFGSYVFEMNGKMAIMIIERLIEGKTLDSLSEKILEKFQVYDRVPEILEEIFESRPLEISNLDTATSNIILNSQGEIFFIDHGSTNCKNKNGLFDGKITEIDIY